MHAVTGGNALHDVSGRIEDWADTAGLISGLDLVIAVDTAVAHLAGALGRPVWLLNRFDSCWRWFFDRDDTPWYPTMRLFRQTSRGDWAGVIERVHRALEEQALGR
jgi:ADP-heptose:LPS heptosyltransferase